MTCTILLIRHGETEWNLQRRFQGRADISLNDRGYIQAEKVAHALVGQQINLIYTSPLTRTKQTAKVIGHKLKVDVLVRHPLIERSFGTLEGMLRTEAEEKWGGITDKIIVKCGGEAVEDVQTRGWAVLQEIRKRHIDQIIVAVSHGAWISAITSKLRSCLNEIVFGNCSITKLVCNDHDEWNISTVNLLLS
ncbi:histidine phosphatase family protein [Bacillus sp. CECT 9360]|uniref:histidine phosphatase family protein n=1 Tax=Bacillus sp. CECT 9360 TaxID=2845821 RepID=UPI001E3B43E0|nr:histidine phosphatase family protein [Bacillus sp. CECT 9360]CAH0345484.1 Phosphoserine phosphatase 1 [Bacillus sp. CECT 9360]